MVDLHIHTKYSLLDAISEPKDLIEKIKQQDKTAICITEHGNLYSSIEVYKLCKEYGIKYLHGCEMYICDDVNIKSKDNKYYHLILISKNETGRLNLIKLVSESNKYKYYGKPRIDFNMLLAHKDGLVVLSACMAGEVQRNLMANNYDKAKEIALKYKTHFQDDYYLEFQSHSEITQQSLNRQIIDLANEINIKYVVTTDAHYINKEDQKYHNIFVKIGQAREVGETYNDCFVQSEKDILNICQSTTTLENQIAIKNTQEIADKCNVIIPLSPPIMPHINIPKKYKSEIDYLKHLCVDGWEKRKLNLLSDSEKNKYKKRLLYEVTTIEKMGFEGYYLLVWSYANSVQRRGIARGSGGGSLVAYLINIVDTDPVKYGLYFERFIDVGALDLLKKGLITKSQLKIPDFDLDFGKEDRNKVLEFVINQYTQERVASLGSFQYIWAKGAIKDIGKVLDIPFNVTNEMTSKLDNETIQEVLDLGLLDSYIKIYPDLFDYAQRLAGLPKSFSAHPCGKVICMQPVNYYNATDINDDGEVILQGDMHTAEDLGLIKADFLGLRTVDVIYDTLELIGKNYNYIAPHNINFEDDKVFKNFRLGNTANIFQFESNGMKSTLKNIECNSLYDLTVANALYRPGSMAYIDNYANRKKGVEEYDFLHNDLKPILKNSFGIIIFQEQLIEIGRLAKLNNPDELRKATSKKRPELLNKIKPELFNGLKNRGWTEKQLNSLWETMLAFAKYSFNKSHSLAYAMTAYICMFLKTYHTKEFIVSCINSYNGKIKKIAVCIEDAVRLGLKIYLPTFDKCFGNTIVYNNGILIGTNSIKNCNYQIAEELTRLSNNHYNNFIELLTDIKTKTSVNSKQLTILVGLNFFERFGHNQYLLNIINVYDKFYSCKQIKKAKIPELGISEFVVKKYSNKETPKTYSGIDNQGLISELCKNIENKSMSIIDSVKFEKEYLEYVTYVNPIAHKDYYIIVNFKQYKNVTKPYFTARRIKDGEEIKARIKNGKVFKENPFGLFSVLKIKEFDKEFKKRPNSVGKWVVTDEVEDVLNSYEVIK